MSYVVSVFCSMKQLQQDHFQYEIFAALFIFPGYSSKSLLGDSSDPVVLLRPKPGSRRLPPVPHWSHWRHRELQLAKH